MTRPAPTRDIPVARDQRRSISQPPPDQRAKGSRLTAYLTKQDLVGGEIVRLVSRIAEEVLEEAGNPTPKTDPARTRQQCTLPDHDGRYVQQRLAPLARRKVIGRLLPQAAAARCMKQQRVSIGYSGGDVSHALFSLSAPAAVP